MIKCFLVNYHRGKWPKFSVLIIYRKQFQLYSTSREMTQTLTLSERGKLQKLKYMMRVIINFGKKSAF